MTYVAAYFGALDHALLDRLMAHGGLSVYPERARHSHLIGVAQKAECGKFKKPRFFLIDEPDEQVTNRYFDPAARSIAIAYKSISQVILDRH